MADGGLPRRGFAPKPDGVFPAVRGGRGVRPLHVELLDVTAAPAPYWDAVERALLGRWVEELHCSCGRAPLVVPESNLAVQLFLREARYRAVRVLKDYYGDEDGYLMTQAAP